MCFLLLKGPYSLILLSRDPTTPKGNLIMKNRIQHYSLKTFLILATLLPLMCQAMENGSSSTLPTEAELNALDAPLAQLKLKYIAIEDIRKLSPADQHAIAAKLSLIGKIKYELNAFPNSTILEVPDYSPTKAFNLLSALKNLGVGDIKIMNGNNVNCCQATYNIQDLRDENHEDYKSRLQLANIALKKRSIKLKSLKTERKSLDDYKIKLEIKD